jgi:hypothetical protein
MRDYTIKHLLVGVLSATLGGIDAYALATAPVVPASGQGRAVVVTGTLTRGAAATHPMNFERGREYRVAALCPVGPCGDLTLRLFSPAGVELDRHEQRRTRDDVSTIPSGTGRYRVDVTMHRCASDACSYALVVQRR